VGALGAAVGWEVWMVWALGSAGPVWAPDWAPFCASNSGAAMAAVSASNPAVVIS
jgi:hypothetical protein